MSEIEIAEVVAERLLSGTENGSAIEVRVQIGKPVPHVEGDWICPYKIVTANDSRTFYAGGVDAVQALSLALFAIGSELKNYYKGLDLCWLESKSLGFPVEGPNWTASK